MLLHRIAPLPQAWRILALTFCLLAVTWMAADSSQAAAKATPVNCTDISMTFDGKDYDVACDINSEMLAGMSGTVESQHLAATASDSSNFVDAYHFTLQGQVIYTSTDLRSNLESFYGHLELKDWRSGRLIANLSTAEFTTEMRGLPSNCIAFQRLGHHDWYGYKKIMVGVACSQGNIEQSYDALKRLYLPK